MAAVARALDRSLRSDGTYEVTAVFDDVRGLIEGGEVKAGGRRGRQGRGDHASPTTGCPRCGWRSTPTSALRQGAFANIRLASNIGAINRFVDLTQGDGPELGDGATLGPSQHRPAGRPRPRRLDPRPADARGGGRAARRTSTRPPAGAAPTSRRTFRYSARGARRDRRTCSRQVTADQHALEQLVDPGPRRSSARSPATPTTSARPPSGWRRTLDAARRPPGRARAGPPTRSAPASPPPTGRSTGSPAVDARAARRWSPRRGPAVAELAPTARELRPAIAALRPLVAEARRLTAPLERAAARAAAGDRRGAADRRAAARRCSTGSRPLLDHLRARAPGGRQLLHPLRRRDARTTTPTATWSGSRRC